MVEITAGSRQYVLIAVPAALMSAFAVVRHTRQSEETGRAELVGAGVVGRHAALAAASSSRSPPTSSSRCC